MAQNNDQAIGRPDDGGGDRPATTSQPTGTLRKENMGGQPLPGDERLDMDRTPGDGSLQGSTPAGLTVKELLERAEDADDMTQPRRVDQLLNTERHHYGDYRCVPR